MALIKCPECGREISDKASSCIGCGYPITPKASIARIKMPTFKFAHNSFMREREYGILNITNDDILWRGKIGSIAEINLESSVIVKIRYFWKCFPNNVKLGMIEPGKNYRIDEDFIGGFKLTEIQTIVF